MTQEQIGNVILDLTYYSGEDRYCDGEVEDRLLTIAKENDAASFDRIIREEKDWATLYHLSSIRGNIVSWIPFTGEEKVLEIGAGPGAVTGDLTGRCRRVDCVELSGKRSRINAYRHRDCGNLIIHVGNFEDIEPVLDRDYDYIFLIGVLEYAESYLRSGEPFRDELQRVLAHLREGGRAVIAIENRLGLKYWAGCAEDHSGRYFDGIESYPGGHPPARTFTRPALEKLLRESGAGEYTFYYPYPDYKFPSVLYSDRRLPHASELSDNIRNFDRDRLLLFDEQKAYRGITEDGLYPLFANSFEVVLGPALPVTYCKFSNDRAPQYRICTQICQGTGGAAPEVRKYPMTPAAAAHVARMEESGQRLARRYGGSGLRVAPCRRIPGGGVAFPFVRGRSLESLLDECLKTGDGEGFLTLLRAYREKVGGGCAEPVSDYDMTFANILIDGDVWTAIDYEWAVEERIGGDELLLRSLLVYDLEEETRRQRREELIGRERIRELTGPAEEEADRLAAEEQAFQDRVTGGVTSLGELRAQLGTDVIKPAQLQTAAEKAAIVQKKAEEEKTLTSVQIYYDRGSGYREEDSWWLDEQYGEEGLITFTLEVTEDIRTVRVDPTICPCLVMVRRVLLDGRDCTHRACRDMKTDGQAYANGSILYTTSDPWMEWKSARLRRAAGIRDGRAFQMELTIQMTGLPSTMASAMS